MFLYRLPKTDKFCPNVVCQFGNPEVCNGSELRFETTQLFSIYNNVNVKLHGNNSRLN